MQSKVPKFLDIEDKVVAGITWRQLMLLLMSAGFSVVFFTLFRPFIGIPLAMIAIGFAVAIGFVKINGRPFHIFLKAIWSYHFNPHRYFWRREESKVRLREKSRATKMRPTATEDALSGQPVEEKLEQLAEQLDAHKQEYRE